VVLALILGLLPTACGSSRGAASATTPPPTNPAPATPASTAPIVPPPTAPSTTRYTPHAAQTSPDAAAAALVNAWASGDQATAATVAAPGAVAELFAVPYPGAGLAMARGCSSGFAPVVCTYGPPGGAAPTDRVFEISVAQDAAGWYVTSVRTLT
jgi:hypothetical protein